ncbi:MAG: rod shape-determining protein RodA [Gammaproteobacteria bacterium]|nr:rod shape-determining protein RodA [Gammaproteobacteria bacterium]
MQYRHPPLNNITSSIPRNRSPLYRWHLDSQLTQALLFLIGFGLIILYSAGNENVHTVEGQCIRLGFAALVLLGIAQIPPYRLRIIAPWLFFIGLFLLIAVMAIGDVGKGARRWLDFGVIRFQPSEIMKLALPMYLAALLHEKILPPSFKMVCTCFLIILVPVGLTALQPDLGTALMLLLTGFCVIFLAGLPYQYLLLVATLAAGAVPVLWHFMHAYQRQRVLTFLNPETDPLGHGYHIIQSKIAIGSGGLFGKGWLMGTQAHLNFLPEHATDFIFAVAGEELGLVGALALLVIYAWVVGRGCVIAYTAQDTFSRLLAGSLTIAFFFNIFVNIGMVCGLLPVVGIPLPLVSYGGTSMVTLMAAFGVLMSIQTHRRLWSN